MTGGTQRSHTVSHEVGMRESLMRTHCPLEAFHTIRGSIRACSIDLLFSGIIE